MKSLFKSILATVVSLLIIFSNSLFNPNNNNVYALSDFQRNNADEIAQICIDNWDTYGVLPSVACGQAMGESQLGLHAFRSYNYWGIKCKGNSFSSLYEGTIKYLSVINNGYYKSAPFVTDWETQIEKIGPNYCPEAGYVSYIKSCIMKNDFSKYDKKLFDQLEKNREERKKKKKEEAKKKKEAEKKAIGDYESKLVASKEAAEEAREKEVKEQYKDVSLTLAYSDEVPNGTLSVNKYIIPEGEAVSIDDGKGGLAAGVSSAFYNTNNVVVTTSDIIPSLQNDNVAYTSNKQLIGLKVNFSEKELGVWTDEKIMLTSSPH